MALKERFAQGVHNLNEKVADSFVGRYFKLRDRGSTLTTELRAGVATFLTMAYILAVNAAILTDSGGPCSAADCEPTGEGGEVLGGVEEGGWCIFPNYPFNPEGGANLGYERCLQTVRYDLITATAASSLIGTFLMGAFANLPLAIAPGMGVNAYFTYTVVGYRGTGNVTYSAALTAAFIEGWLFFLLAITGLRLRLAKAIPAPVKLATGVGIGIFLSFIGLQQSEGVGLVTMDTATLVGLGGCPPAYRAAVAPVEIFQNGTAVVTGPSSGNYICTSKKMRSATLWLGICGFIVIAWAQKLRLNGAMIYGIAFVTFISWIPNHAASYLSASGGIAGADIRKGYFNKVATWHSIEKTAVKFDFGGLASGNVWLALATFFYVDVMDATGTLYSMAKFAGYVDEKGDFPGQYQAFISDSLAIVAGSTLGTSPCTVFIESAAGIREGGRTGLTALTVGFFFFVALFFSPIFASIPPYATGPALVIVGSMMAKACFDIRWNVVGDAVPAFVTIILMPLTYSIAYGVIGGICVYMILNVPDWFYYKYVKKSKYPEDEYDSSTEPKQGFKAKGIEEADELETHDFVSKNLPQVDMLLAAPGTDGQRKHNVPASPAPPAV